MPNGTYGGVRGRKTKVGRKLLRFPPTRLLGYRLYKNALSYDMKQGVERRKTIYTNLHTICTVLNTLIISKLHLQCRCADIY